MNSFRCIHCCAEVPTLYTRYTDDIIKTEFCGRCGNVADKYIEFDIFIVAVDLLVLRIEAYRHLIHNSSDKSWVRLLTLSFVLNSFVSWLSEQPKTNVDFANLSLYFNSDLYVHIITNFVLSLCFAFLVQIACCSVKQRPPWTQSIRLLSIINFGRLLSFFVLPWNDKFIFHNANLSFYTAVSSMASFLACFQSFRALTSCSYAHGLFSSLFVCLSASFLLSLLDPLL
ncbi:protein ARV1, partial [Clonorchis sinensis]